MRSNQENSTIEGHTAIENNSYSHSEKNEEEKNQPVTILEVQEN